MDGSFGYRILPQRRTQNDASEQDKNQTVSKLGEGERPERNALAKGKLSAQFLLPSDRVLTQPASDALKETQGRGRHVTTDTPPWLCLLDTSDWSLHVNTVNRTIQLALKLLHGKRILFITEDGAFPLDESVDLSLTWDDVTIKLDKDGNRYGSVVTHQIFTLTVNGESVEFYPGSDHGHELIVREGTTYGTTPKVRLQWLCRNDWKRPFDWDDTKAFTIGMTCANCFPWIGNLSVQMPRLSGRQYWVEPC